MNRHLLILFSLITLVSVTPLLVLSTYTITPPRVLRELGLYYVENTVKDTYSPEAVAAIVWDYRGLDTIYETLVLYLAIVGGLSIFMVTREIEEKKGSGLTILAKTSTKIITLLITTISVSIALHGHLTPGGGFQGGSSLAVVTMLIIPVFSAHSMTSRGVTSTRLVAIRGLSLSALGSVAFLPVIRGLEIVTNTRFYPGVVGGLILSGSISLYNLFEFFAVSSGFTAIALYLSIPEEVYSKKIGESGV